MHLYYRFEKGIVIARHSAHASGLQHYIEEASSSHRNHPSPPTAVGACCDTPKSELKSCSQNFVKNLLLDRESVPCCNRQHVAFQIIKEQCCKSGEKHSPESNHLTSIRPTMFSLYRWNSGTSWRKRAFWRSDTYPRNKTLAFFMVQQHFVLLK